LEAVKDSKILALFGTEYVGLVISSYFGGELHHAHNSWLEALMRMGIPGLLMSLVFTALAVWSAVKLVFNRSVELWKKIVAMLTVCLLGAGFLEPYLFITNVYYHVTDFAFFFLAGYLDYWANAEE
jgi:O-antigen ligase